jgi:hypothetical protein
MDRLRYFLAPDHNYFLFRFKKFTSSPAVAGSLFAAYASTEEKTTFEIGSAAATSPRQRRRRTTPFAWTTPKKSTDRPYGVISTVARARIEYFEFFEYFPRMRSHIAAAPL